MRERRKRKKWKKEKAFENVKPKHEKENKQEFFGKPYDF